ncbi:MAG: hypothetical protein QM500_04100 [Methylococcales bacterium]
MKEKIKSVAVQIIKVKSAGLFDVKEEAEKLAELTMDLTVDMVERIEALEFNAGVYHGRGK